MRFISKINPLVTILFILFLVVGLIIPYSYFIDNIGNIKTHSDDGGIGWPALIASIAFTGLELYFIFRIVNRFLIVSINLPERTITFHYPLRFLKTEYEFDEINSFQFSSFYSKICKFKCLIFKSKTNRDYQITDFETRNFRVIEAIAVDNFELSTGKSQEILVGDEKIAALASNKKFDIDQANEYRFACYLNFVLVIGLYFANKYLAIPDRKFGWVAWSLCLLLIVFSLLKIVQANRIIRKNKEHS